MVILYRIEISLTNAIFAATVIIVLTRYYKHLLKGA